MDLEDEIERFRGPLIEIPLFRDPTRNRQTQPILTDRYGGLVLSRNWSDLNDNTRYSVNRGRSFDDETTKTC